MRREWLVGGRSGKVGKVRLRLGKVGGWLVVGSCSCSGAETLKQDKWTSMKRWVHVLDIVLTIVI